MFRFYGVKMEIIKFLLSFFLNEYGGKDLTSIYELLERNSFDIGKTLKNLTPETIAPVIKVITENFSNKKTPTETVGEKVGLAPLVSFADKEIVATLNKYFTYA